MSILNTWLDPLQRSYQDIKLKLLDGLDDIKDSNGNTLITDKSEGNIFNILISQFSAREEILHYYIDKASRESMFGSAQRYTSLVNHASLVDYRPKSAYAATVDIILYRPAISDSITGSVSIPEGTVFTDIMGHPWVSTKSVTWSANTTLCLVPCIQHRLYDITAIQGLQIPVTKYGYNPKIMIPSTAFTQEKYEEGTLVITLSDGNSYILVDTLAKSKSTDNHFVTETDINGNIWVIFGDGRFGHKPSPTLKISRAQCYITFGSEGNTDENTITSVPNTISSSVTDATCNNPYAATGGTDFEDDISLKNRVPLSVKTLGVAITAQDFEDLAKLLPSVNQAKVEYICGKCLNLYITPAGGTIASSYLLDYVQQYIEQHTTIGTTVNVKPVGIADVFLDIEVTGYQHVPASAINSQVVQALMDYFSYQFAEIGGHVRLSDIYGLLENLSLVDYLYIKKFIIKPWPSTIKGNHTLDIIGYDVVDIKGSMKYLITMIDNNQFIIRSKSRGFHVNGYVGTALLVKDTLNNAEFSLTIGHSQYSAGDSWSIVVSEPNMNYEDVGYNLPIITNSSNITLKVNEVL